jgi:hypothetical protein
MITPEQLERFFRNVDKDGPIPERYPNLGRCWIWRGRIDKDGYGSTSLGKSGFRAHRLSWIIARGGVPDCRLVLHFCDRPGCVNPDHLWIGTQADNVRDRVEKGRSAKGDNHGRRTHPERNAKGTKVHGSKLNEQSVREIRGLFASGRSKNSIAKQFGVAHFSIRSIISRKTWAWL